MNKITSIVLFVVILFASSVVYAQGIMPVPPQDSGDGFFGQDHYYSVVFRGNGEAVVTGKVVVTNTENSPLTQLQLRVPNVIPNDIAVYQIQRQKQCVRYDNNSECMEYSEPDYSGYYYGKTDYFKADTSLSGDTITVQLPNQLETNKTGSIIMYYRANGYTKKNWTGSYSFSFESPKVNSVIRNLQIGISTDSDLVLKQAEGSVNYRPQADTMAFSKVAEGGATLSSSQFDRISQNIGYGSISKNASNLQPLESFTVTGEFAKNGWQLYGNEILIGVLLTILFVAVVFFVVRFLYKRMSSKGTSPKSVLSGRDILIAGINGFISSFLILVYSIFVILIMYFFTRNSFGSYHFTSFISVALLIVSAGVYMFLFITPAVVVGIKKSVWAGVATAFISLVWMFVYLVIGVVIVMLVGNRNNPVYYYDSGVTPLMKTNSAPAAEGSALPQ